MFCESCREKEATIHLTQVVDGAVKKVHFCDACATKSGFDLQSSISITDILLGMGGEKSPSKPLAQERVCSYCTMKRGDFKKYGRLGCTRCYETFAGELVSVVKAMHRSEQHMGKVPASESVRTQLSTELAVLQKTLNQAIVGENYEEAARIRDRIQACRTQMAEENKSTSHES